MAKLIHLLKLSPADIVGFSISAVAALVAIIACVNLYFLFKVSNGKVEKSFKKIIIGVFFTMITVAFLGFSFGPMNTPDSMLVAIVGPIIWLIGNCFLASGFSERSKKILEEHEEAHKK